MWEGIKSAFTAAWDWLVGIFQKGMEWIKGVIFGASDWVLGAVALFFPFIGIPALVIKHWDSIKEFFANLWTGMVGGFQSAWEGIKGFFANLWDGVKGVITGFVDWVSGIIDFFLAPFRAIFDGISSIFGGITNMVGGIVDKVGGVVGGIGDFFGGLFGGAKESGSQMNDAFAQGIQSNASAPASAFGNSLRGIDSQMPHSDADEGPLSRLSASGRALTDTFARGMDPSTLEQRASQAFQAAAPSGEYAFPEGREASNDRERPSQVTIQNLYVQSEDFENAYDFIRQIMHMVERPQGVPV
jgi:phage-related protein